MSNQWGRGPVVANDGSRRSSGFLFPALAILLLAITAGYFWYAREASEAKIAEAKAKIEALSSQLAAETELKDKAISDLSESRADSGIWARTLETENNDLKNNELPKLNRLLDARDLEISELEKKLEAVSAGQTSGEAAVARSSEQLAQARTTIADLRRSLDVRTKEMETLADQVAALKTRLAGHPSPDKRTEETAALRSELNQARNVDIPALRRALDDERRTVTTLRQQIADSNVQQAPAPSDTSNGSSANRPVRNEADVARALDSARGLGVLDDTQTRDLRRELVSGVCVVRALEHVFGRAPLIAMRDLMRELQSDC